ncbi:MAG: HK97 family phage prohead protease [Methylorubrum rhodinum]|uniref:HK97 family phage prohead protease n=1 Tax=Methylorubrum rhodinum TaxID=29428 RepID=UPI003BAF89E7
MTIHRKALGAVAEAVEGSRRIVVTCSTEAVDRVGDVVVQAGISVANFLRSKTVLWNHDQDRPIAKAVELGIVDGLLKAVVEFPPEGISKLADEIYGLIKAGVINAVSIGFLPLTAVPLDGKSVANGVQVTESELLELSFVSVPANPGAEIMERSIRRKALRSPRVVVKSLYDLSSLVHALDLLGSVTQGAKWEAEYEGDGSTVPDQLAEACRGIGAILVAMTTEEVAEFIAHIAPEAQAAVATASAGEETGEQKNIPGMVLKAARALPGKPGLVAKAGVLLSAGKAAGLVASLRALIEETEAAKDDIAKSEAGAGDPDDPEAEADAAVLASLPEDEAATASAEADEAILASLDDDETTAANLDDEEAAQASLDDEETIAANLDDDEAALASLDDEETTEANLDDEEAAQASLDDEETAEANLDDEEATEASLAEDEAALASIDDEEAAAASLNEEETGTATKNAEQLRRRRLVRALLAA